MEKYIFRDGRFTAKLECPRKEWGYDDDDERMQRRIDKFTSDYAKARKFRRKPLVAEVRKFPTKREAAEMSTLQYVTAYCKLNSLYCSLGQFEPLSDKVTPVPPGYYDDPVAEPLDD